MGKACVLMMTCIILAGCENVKYLDRNYLAKEQMSKNPYPVESAFQQHTYQSREATQSGMGTTGGSDCGCT
jgi:hypothetical protein